MHKTKTCEILRCTNCKQVGHNTRTCKVKKGESEELQEQENSVIANQLQESAQNMRPSAATKQPNPVKKQPCPLGTHAGIMRPFKTPHLFLLLQKCAL